VYPVDGSCLHIPQASHSQYGRPDFHIALCIQWVNSVLQISLFPA